MIKRLAYLSMHTCPMIQPGSGDAGGMNVYIHELAREMAQRGIAVDVFTRRREPALDDEVEAAPGYRVVHLDAGPHVNLPIGALAPYVGDFAEGVVKWGYENGVSWDVVHSHYWLSAWAGAIVKEATGLPLANSFHTLGRVKDLTRRADESGESITRTFTESEVIARSDCVIAATPFEFEDLLVHYNASPERLCISPPGIDHAIFMPGDKQAARTELGMGPGPVLLFVGRIQPLKGLDVAVDALGILRHRVPDARLYVVGGPSGAAGDNEYERILARVAELDLGGAVTMVPPQSHHLLATYYQAADVLVMPSRSESFGLVAAEAQACGLPVIAANTGGLAHIVKPGASGILVDGWDPAEYATVAERILTDPVVGAALSSGGIEFARRFSWQATTDRLLELYSGITEAR